MQNKGKNHESDDGLSADIQHDYPTVDADTGILYADATGVLALRDVNSKSSEVDCRVPDTGRHLT